ncbi:MAG: tetratricopeptide repeat protein [Bacteroidetes bacterium]|nr:tetratricopeptide repeat protein [Bacteroidota bacterium]
MKKNKPKFILLGWDAADWKVINPMIEQGLLPNLEKLINEGIMGNLATLDPPYSPMLWTSIGTGKRPYKHGVHGFHEPWDKGPGVRPVMSTTRTCKAIWNILTQEGFKSHVLGWWPSHPAEPVNGVAISDFFARPAGRQFEAWPVAEGSVHPKEMEEYFGWLRIHPEELTSSIIELFVPNWEKADSKQQTRLGAIQRETAIAATLHNCFTNILREQEWDFAALYLATIDHYCHGFMKYHPPKRPHIPQPDYDMFHNVITAGYRYHDMMLGRILDLAGEDAFVMLVSDHGFQPDHLRPRNIPKEPAGPAYEHSPQGIFMLKGPGIKKDELLYGASLLDVTPTILTCLDLPVGEDMDGKVLTQVFEQEKEPQTIESWEKVAGECGMHPEGVGEDEDANARALEQLVELGYIEKPGDDAEKNRLKTEEECNFNLAKAYMDGGKLGEAIPLLEELYKSHPDTSRYAFQLATCYQSLGQLKECRKVIEEMRDKEFFNETTLDVMEGSLLLGERRPVQAIKLFKKAEEKVDPFHSRLYLQIARGYSMLGRWEDAERALHKDIELDYDHAAAHAMLGQVYLSDNQFDKAVDSLLTAIGLQYDNPDAHYRLGMALKNLGEYERAADAFEVVLAMAPMGNVAREQLVELYTYQLDQAEKAAEHLQHFDHSLQGTITIVSGLPRSGTSMLMQMLEAGGMDIFTDKERKPDENNPKGYYEHDAVKSLARNKKWLPEAEGKVVKVVANLLPHLPPRYRYRIVFMERDLHEVLASQRKMLKRLGKKTKDEVYPTGLMKAFEKQVQKAKTWASRQANVEVLYLKHADVLAEPFPTAMRLNGFFNNELLPERMAQVPDSKLHHEKSTRPKTTIANNT